MSWTDVLGRRNHARMFTKHLPMLSKNFSTENISSFGVFRVQPPVATDKSRSNCYAYNRYNYLGGLYKWLAFWEASFPGMSRVFSLEVMHKWRSLKIRLLHFYVHFLLQYTSFIIILDRGPKVD